MALSWSLTLCLWLHNMGRVQLRNQHSSRKRAHHLVYFSPASFHTNTQTPVDSRQNGGRSPKQSDFLDDPFLSCKTPQRGAATVLGSDVGVPGGEARNQAFCGDRTLGPAGMLWRHRPPNSNWSPLLCLDLLLGGFRKQVFP